MANERLRTALLERGRTPADLAGALGVDPKSVERWISGRVPYRRHRYAVAAYLELDEAYLWPDALTRDEVAGASESEIVTIHAHRWAVPRDAWSRLFRRAESEIGVLVYVGMFLAEDSGMLELFTAKARSGVRVRLLIGDPDSPAVAERGADEGIDDSLAAKVRNAFVLYKPLRGVDNVEIRLHRTVLYNSIYRADDELFVNTHVYGFPASVAPVLHLRKVAGGDMVNTYLTSFDRVWSSASPWE